MELTAVVISVNEPQLRECLNSIIMQRDYSFIRTIHINNVSPVIKAESKAWELVNTKWSVWIGGDFILYEDALIIIHRYMDEYPAGDDVAQYNFGLFDTFLNIVIGCCSVRNKDAFMSVEMRNVLKHDQKVTSQLEQMGWKRYRPVLKNIVVGTHFENPDDFQVWRRFYARGCKDRTNRYGELLLKRFRLTGNPQFKLALSALRYGQKRREYRSSHDINYDLGIYEEWKKLQ